MVKQQHIARKNPKKKKKNTEGMFFPNSVERFCLVRISHDTYKRVANNRWYYVMENHNRVGKARGNPSLHVGIAGQSAYCTTVPIHTNST